MIAAEEFPTFLAAAHGDLAVLLGLLSLRRVENGGPGRELGVLSKPAPTLDDQARIAAASFRKNEGRAALVGINARAGVHGLYTDPFLRFFSARWCPVGVENDPTHLNEAHASNLIASYGVFRTHALAALQTFLGA